MIFEFLEGSLHVPKFGSGSSRFDNQMESGGGRRTGKVHRISPLLFGKGNQRPPENMQQPIDCMVGSPRSFAILLMARSYQAFTLERKYFAYRKK